MRIYITSILTVFLLLGCSSEKKTVKTIAKTETSVPKIVNLIEGPMVDLSYNPYDIAIKMDREKKNIYSLDIQMLLRDGSFFVSPNSERDFKGKFRIDIEENNAIESVSELIETPLSQEVFDPHPFVNGYVNWVKVNTNYKQFFLRTSDKDFKVGGVVRFVIEPRCTLEEIPFIITYEKGKMWIMQNDGC
ncbi:hypothetical protein [Tenacibaculum amylolyticum]|uniref:hypothetical protein n=1 Tax=Tenacibaculum amylolyticum TaxID=104269 RepID=UPI0038934216